MSRDPGHERHAAGASAASRVAAIAFLKREAVGVCAARLARAHPCALLDAAVCCQLTLGVKWVLSAK